MEFYHVDSMVFFQEIISLKYKGWAYVINIDKYSDVITNWIVFYCKNDEILYFDSFGVEHVPKEKEKFIGHKNIKTNIFRVKSSNLIMFGYFCIGFIYFMF